MKLLWCTESWRMVRVSPSAPSRTSWCASSPRSRTECTRTPSTSAPRAPSSAVTVASGCGAQPASARAAAISCAVRVAVPDGASTLFGWCSSTTSADSKKRAAAWENFIVRTAPMEKLGATSTPVPGEPASSVLSCARRSSVQPVVPTTAWMPWRTQKSRLPITAEGAVSSTTTWAPASTRASRSSSRSRAATRSMSSAASTARAASEPIRPLAPRTATRSLVLIALLPCFLRRPVRALVRRPLRRDGPPACPSEGR